jgi:hypothetical protein
MRHVSKMMWIEHLMALPHDSNLIFSTNIRFVTPFQEI